MSKIINLPEEIVGEFTSAGHSNLKRIKELYAQYPELIHAVDQWGESALSAAAHSGQRDIAEYLIEKGAKLDICTAAMLGLEDEVAERLEKDPTQANATGAHDIPIIYHAALSGNTRIADMLMNEGGGDRLNTSLHGATRYGHLAMTQWFLKRDADVMLRDFKDRTPLEVAVEKGFDDVAEALREHIGTENLTECKACGSRGYQIVSRIDGIRWKEHTTHYECKNCGGSMGNRYSAGR